MLLLIAINALPLLVVGLGWRRYREERAPLSRLRQRVFVSALVANATSAVVLLIFCIHGTLMFSGAVRVAELDRMYPVMEMMGAGVLSAVLAAFGRRAFRRILTGNGLLAALLWYELALGFSP